MSDPSEDNVLVAGIVPPASQYHCVALGRALADLGLAEGAIFYRLYGEGWDWTKHGLTAEQAERVKIAYNKIKDAQEQVRTARRILWDISLGFGS